MRKLLKNKIGVCKHCLKMEWSWHLKKTKIREIGYWKFIFLAFQVLEVLNQPQIRAVFYFNAIPYFQTSALSEDLCSVYNFAATYFFADLSCNETFLFQLSPSAYCAAVIILRFLNDCFRVEEVNTSPAIFQPWWFWREISGKCNFIGWCKNCTQVLRSYLKNYLS